MRAWIFHILNIIIFIIIEPIFIFAWLAAGSLYIRFMIIIGVVLWGTFYFIQFRRQTYTWRLTWFIISVIVLWFWIDFWSLRSLGGWV